jgi:hypothetical protein
MAKLRLGLCGAVALLGAMCLPIAAADAATVTDTFSFSASGFTPSGSPVDPWTGSFTITYDPAGGVQSGALPSFSSNLPAIYGPFSFVYFGVQIGGLDIGDDCFNNSCGVSTGIFSAMLFFFPATLSGAGAGISNISQIFFSTSATVTSTPAIPLPAALPLFATGLGALGLLGWRQEAPR